jgi:hypothetical protein
MKLKLYILIKQGKRKENKLDDVSPSTHLYLQRLNRKNARCLKK